MSEQNADTGGVEHRTKIDGRFWSCRCGAGRECLSYQQAYTEMLNHSVDTRAQSGREADR
jgi:hypothetical protein